MSTTSFDAARFAKVRTLHDAATSPGERAAAAGRLKALAASAGMTVEQAIASIDKADVRQRRAEREAAILNDLDWLFGGP